MSNEFTREEQSAHSAPDESVRKAWARFSNELHRSPDAPYPEMSEAFERHFSQSFTDREWRVESGIWAAAWKAAKNHGAQPAPSFADAYQGAREDVAIWKKRALEAEDLNRKFVAETNGPAYMGEPAQHAPSVQNTMLLTAAPALLEALKWMVLRTEEGGYPDGKCLEEARAAIAKATGERP